MPQVLGLPGGQSKVLAIVAEQADVDAAMAKLKELMEATVIVRSSERDENGRCKYVKVPNVGIQLAAATKFLEFTTGKPRQSIEMTNNTAGGQKASGLNDLAHLLHKNPQIANSVMSALRDAANIAQAIPVEAVAVEMPAQPSESESGGRPSQ